MTPRTTQTAPLPILCHEWRHCFTRYGELRREIIAGEELKPYTTMMLIHQVDKLMTQLDTALHNYCESQQYG